MTFQLKEGGLVDRRYKYNADGIISTNSHTLEILLAEVSNGYGSNDQNKISFDHNKAMFGMLAMIKTIAQKYEQAQLSTFKKLKVHFLHGFGRRSYLSLQSLFIKKLLLLGQGVRHWSLSMQISNVFLMIKEQRVEVPVRFDEKDLKLISFIEFYKTVAVSPLII